MATQLSSITFIGGGNMASAMIKGLLELKPRPRIAVSEPDAEKRAVFAELGCSVFIDNAAAIADAQIIVLAIKPQMTAQVVPGLAATWKPTQVLVSIVAGTPIARLASWLPDGARIVRTMPNTPLAIGEGMVGMCAGPGVSADDLALATSIFAPCGKVLTVSNEERMDAITAVSGSGPAYFFRFAEALVAAAKVLGFTNDEAVLLVSQTGAGAWHYLLNSDFAATRLREQVTSPGGTTAAALRVLDDADFTGLITRALQAAEQRGQELAKG